jgi:hypothetical protein
MTLTNLSRAQAFTDQNARERRLNQRETELSVRERDIAARERHLQQAEAAARELIAGDAPPANVNTNIPTLTDRQRLATAAAILHAGDLRRGLVEPSADEAATFPEQSGISAAHLAAARRLSAAIIASGRARRGETEQ